MHHPASPTAPPSRGISTPKRWETIACRIVGRNRTCDECAQQLPDRDYQKTRHQWPGGA
jgi:hypothetical protein